MDGLLGGPKGMLAPLSNYCGGGGVCPPPLAPLLPTPMSLSKVFIVLSVIETSKYKSV